MNNAILVFYATLTDGTVYSCALEMAQVERAHDLGVLREQIADPYGGHFHSRMPEGFCGVLTVKVMAADPEAMRDCVAAEAVDGKLVESVLAEPGVDEFCALLWDALEKIAGVK